MLCYVCMGVKDNNSNFCHYLPTNANVLLLLLYCSAIPYDTCVILEIYADFCGRFGSFVFLTSASSGVSLVFNMVAILLLLLLLSLYSFTLAFTTSSFLLTMVWSPLLLVPNQINFPMLSVLRFFHFEITHNMANISILETVCHTQNHSHTQH